MLKIWERAFKLIEEAEGDDIKIQTIILNLGLVVECRNQITPLHHASSLGRTIVVQSLLQANANVHAVTPSGLTSLHCASREGHVDVMKLLIKANSCINARNHDDGTCLHSAAHWGRNDAVKLLIASNAEFYKHKMKFSSLYYSCKNGHVEVTKTLIEASCPIDAHPGGLSCLHASISSSSTECVQLLLKSGFDVNMKTELKEYEWYTPLACAIDHANSGMVKTLLAAGADVNMYVNKIRASVEQCPNKEVRMLVEKALSLASKEAKRAEEELLRLFDETESPRATKKPKKKKKKKKKRRKSLRLVTQSEIEMRTEIEPQPLETAESDDVAPTADEEDCGVGEQFFVEPAMAELYAELDRQQPLLLLQQDELREEMSAEVMSFLDRLGPTLSQYTLQLATEFESVSAIRESYQTLEYRAFAEDYKPMKRHHAKRIIQEAHKIKKLPGAGHDMFAQSIATHKSLTIRELKRLGRVITRYLIRACPDIATKYGDLQSDLTLANAIESLYDCGQISDNQQTCLHVLRKARNVGEHRPNEYLNNEIMFLSDEVKRALDFLGIERKEVSRRPEFHQCTPWGVSLENL